LQTAVFFLQFSAFFCSFLQTLARLIEFSASHKLPKLTRRKSKIKMQSVFVLSDYAVTLRESKMTKQNSKFQLRVSAVDAWGEEGGDDFVFGLTIAAIVYKYMHTY